MTRSSDPVLEAEDLRLETTIEGKQRTLVAGISLQVKPGEVVAIVGESGSGKSLTARALVGLLPRGVRATGRVMFESRNLISADERQLQAVRGTGIGLVMQDPFTTLNPLMRCHTQIRPTTSRHMSRRESRIHAIGRLAEVGIDDPNVADRYPWQLSGGMRQRVALAAALANAPKILIADEFSTALDVTTQKEIWLLLRRIQSARDMALIVITHDLRMAFSLCDRVYVMYAGSILETGNARDVAEEPMHPYTLGLLLSEPDVDATTTASRIMQGNVPLPDEVAGCCAFSPRCPWSADVCVQSRPSLRVNGKGHATACVRFDEIEDLTTFLRDKQTDHNGLPVPPPSRASDGAVVEIRNLRKVFGGTRGNAPDQSSAPALAGVSLYIRSGESVGLVGESGSGKTTLARCIVGLERPTDGTIEIDGLNATHRTRLSGREQRHLQSVVQYVFQDPYSSLNPTKTVRATLAEAAAMRLRRNRHGVAERVHELLSLVGLPASYEALKPISLSGGERQRVAIARALALEPRILICDEPVSALDVSVQAQVLDLLNTIRKETGVGYLFISHDLAVVRQAADRIYVLHRGQILEDGPTTVLLEHPHHDYTRALLAAVPGRWDRDTGVAIPRTEKSV